MTKKNIDSENVTDNEELSDIERLSRFLKRRYEFRYNSISNIIEHRIINRSNGTKKEPYKEMEEGPILFDVLSNNLKCDSTKLGIVLSVIMEKYNPFEEYFTSLPKWDKDNHIEKLCYNYFTIKNTDKSQTEQHRFYQALKKHLVRMVKNALHPTYINKHCLVLVGEKQHTGKSFFVRWLCPEPLKDYIIENINVHEKDALIAMSENFIINMDELATIGKADINILKSFFSKDATKCRVPYGRRQIRKKRYCSFLGSTNNTEFLSDVTGSVRWLNFEVEKINHKYSKEISIDSIYSEAYALYNSGFPCDLTKDEIQENELQNNKHFINTAEMELIGKYFSPDGSDFFTTTDIMDVILGKTIIRQLTLKSVGLALQKLGFERIEHYDSCKKFSIKGWKGKSI